MILRLCFSHHFAIRNPALPAKKYHVTLTAEQRQRAEIVARSYKHSERERKRAQILLLTDTSAHDAAQKDEQIASQVGVCLLTVQQVRRRFAQDGLDAALFRKVQHNRKARALDGHAEAFLIATVCSAPPDGFTRWSLVLLKDRLIALDYVDAVSLETIRQTLKKRTQAVAKGEGLLVLSLHLSQWTTFSTEGSVPARCCGNRRESAHLSDVLSGILVPCSEQVRRTDKSVFSRRVPLAQTPHKHCNSDWDGGDRLPQRL